MIEVYDGFLLQDYPSAGEIRELLIDNFVTPVFAITDDVFAYYERLSSSMLVNTGARVVKITSDSSNIIEAIKTSYEVNIIIHDVQYCN